MEQFVTSCVQVYLGLDPGLALGQASTPFLDEEGRDAPSRSAARNGPLQERPSREHTSPPSPRPDLRAYEQRNKSQWAVVVASGAGSDAVWPAGGDSAAIGVDSSPHTAAEDRRKLALVAARISVKILHGARNEWPDILKAVTRVACFFAKWTSLCDGLLHPLRLQVPVGGMEW